MYERIQNVCQHTINTDQQMCLTSLRAMLCCAIAVSCYSETFFKVGRSVVGIRVRVTGLAPGISTTSLPAVAICCWFS